jgi:hypothetical protein
MDDERRRILQMLSQGKITVSDAEKLLAAVGEAPATAEPAQGEAGLIPAERRKPRYLRVVVEPRGEETNGAPHVNIRVPLQLLRAGIKLGALIPPEAQAQMSEALDEKGIKVNLADLSPEAIEELIEGMSDMTVDVDADEVRVRVFCES